MKLLIAAGLVLLLVVRTSRWRRRLSSLPLTGKILAITVAVGWIAAMVAVLALV